MVYGWLCLFSHAKIFQGSMLHIMLHFKNVEILKNQYLHCASLPMRKVVSRELNLSDAPQNNKIIEGSYTSKIFFFFSWRQNHILSFFESQANKKTHIRDLVVLRALLIREKQCNRKGKSFPSIKLKIPRSAQESLK